MLALALPPPPLPPPLSPLSLSRKHTLVGVSAVVHDGDDEGLPREPRRDQQRRVSRRVLKRLGLGVSKVGWTTTVDFVVQCSAHTSTV